jgi:hypothetical protein
MCPILNQKREMATPHCGMRGGEIVSEFPIRTFGLVCVIVLLAAPVLFAIPVKDRSDGNQFGDVWVTNQDGGQLFILRPEAILHGVGDDPTGASRQTIVLPPGTHPHITTFSPDGAFAYVSDMGMGNLIVIRTADRQIVASLHIGMMMTHQAKSSPDGSLLLVANMHEKTLTKVSANEAIESWTIVTSITLPKAPVCTVFRDDGLRAYVSLLPSGIAIVDVSTMTILGTLSTDGFIACGMIKGHDGTTVFIASTGGGDSGCNPMSGVGTCPGHLYRLDMTADTLSDFGLLNAGSWHSFNLLPNEKTGIGTCPAVDQIVIIDMATSTAVPFDLNPTPGTNNDRPDAIAMEGHMALISLRAAGKLAILDVKKLTVEYIDLAPPSPFAIHGVAIWPYGAFPP